MSLLFFFWFVGVLLWVAVVLLSLALLAVLLALRSLRMLTVRPHRRILTLTEKEKKK